MDMTTSDGTGVLDAINVSIGSVFDGEVAVSSRCTPIVGVGVGVGGNSVWFAGEMVFVWVGTSVGTVCAFVVCAHPMWFCAKNSATKAMAVISATEG
jgi:hypothetical protein